MRRLVSSAETNHKINIMMRGLTKVQKKPSIDPTYWVVMSLLAISKINDLRRYKMATNSINPLNNETVFCNIITFFLPSVRRAIYSLPPNPSNFFFSRTVSIINYIISVIFISTFAVISNGPGTSDVRRGLFVHIGQCRAGCLN